MKKLNKKQRKNNSQLAINLTLLTLLIGITFYAYRALAPQPIKIAEIGDGRKQVILPSETINANATVKLILEGNQSNWKTKTGGQLNVKYDAGTSHLTAADISIEFDPTMIEPLLSDSQFHSDFPTHLSNFKIVDNKIKFAAGIGVGDGGKTGTGTFATIPFKVLEKTGGSGFVISNSSLVTTKEKGLDLRETSNLSFDINTQVIDGIVNPSVSPIASPATSPAASPSIAASASPLASPTTSPAASPLASPTASPTTTKPSTPTNLKYNCYDNGNHVTLRWESVADATNYIVILDHKDSTDDTTVKVTRTESDLSLKTNTLYNWKVAAIKSDVQGDFATLSDIKCNSSSTSGTASPTPSPTPTPTSTPKPTIKPTPKPNIITKAINSIVKPTTPPSPSPIPQVQVTAPSPLAGNLADIFKSPEPTIQPSTSNDQASFVTKIFLGWKALFLRIVESLAN